LKWDKIYVNISAMAVEIETKLIILGAHRERTMEEIASSTGAGPYTFMPKGTKHLRDTYCDTPDTILSGHNIALRTGA
jgi:inorganic triphosphatase YgiF